MARVLMIGIDPDEVDFSDPALPPGMDADKIRAGIALALRALRDAGHDVRQLYIPTEPAKLGMLADDLAGRPVDCVTVGGGIRVPPRNLLLFEAVLNVIARAQPTPAIALVTSPEDAVSAARRVLGRS